MYGANIVRLTPSVHYDEAPSIAPRKAAPLVVLVLNQLSLLRLEAVGHWKITNVQPSTQVLPLPHFALLVGTHLAPSVATN